MQDIEIACAQKGCDEVRLFTVRDQEFYSKKGFSQPKYCRTHSAERKARHQNRAEDNMQEERDTTNDRGRGSVFADQESDSELLA